MGEASYDGRDRRRAAAPHPQSFARRFLRLAGAYWGSEQRWAAWLLTASLVALTVGQVIVPILMNRWNAEFFDALEQKSMERFLLQIATLAAIVAGSVVITATHMRVKRRMMLAWRRWLTRKLLHEWMADGRHHRVVHMRGSDNPDGRIAEDIRIATEAAIELAHSLFYCVLLLVSFGNILWTLSGRLEVDVLGTAVWIPGHMVFLAILYAGAGTGAALLLGQPLVRAVNNRQTAEADFRVGLVRARENSEAIRLLHGESDERRRLYLLFVGIRNAWHRQTRALANILMFTSGYSILAGIFPLLVAAPRYIGGSITLGVLMQTGQAFQQMAAALSWPVDNLQRVAELRASVDRVMTLYDALEELRQPVEQERRGIRIVEGDPSTLAFRDVSLREPDGAPLLAGLSAEVRRGERLLINGDPAAGLKLFKAAAAMWPWGSGVIEVPAGARLFFVPQRPYLPLGPLREAVSYPSGPDSVDDDARAAALRRVGLGHLVPRLNETAAWETGLAVTEQQRLNFARLLLQRPNWIFLQEATDSLDPEDEAELMRLMLEDLPAATVITVGHHAALEPYHQRKLSLAKPPREAPAQSAPAPVP